MQILVYSRRTKKRVERVRKTALMGTMPPETYLGLVKLGVIPAGGETAPSVDGLTSISSTEMAV